jgi:KUP system potassium uptake protein
MSDGVNESAASAEAQIVNGGREAPQSFVALALGSVGVVYGDIGTSPLYAFREAAIAASHDQPVTRDTVLGVLSLILWALIVTVTLKYVLILLRADNNGEGGTLSLTALASRALGRRTAFVFIVGVIGAAMFLGDSVITPAISVLSAVEGLKLASPAFSDYVAPLAVAILIGLFAAQSRGTAKVAALFGPIMVVWFIAIAIAGALQSATIRTCCWRSTRFMESLSFTNTVKSVWLRWVLCFLSSRAARRFTPISAISTVSRSRPLGFAWCCRRF